MNDLLQQHWRRQIVGLVLGLVFLVNGSTGRKYRRHCPTEFESYTVFDCVLALVGLGIMAWCSRQLWVTTVKLREWEGERGATFFAQAEQARRVYQLLVSVAAADGRVDVDEHDVVVQLLTRELPQHVLPSDIHLWSHQVEPLADPTGLALSLGSTLARPMRDRVLQWCREVASLRPDDASARLVDTIARALVANVASSGPRAATEWR